MLKKGEILNLPAYHFYIKVGALNPEEPFSGETIPVETGKNNKWIDKVIQTSQQHYASVYLNKPKQKVEEQIQTTKESVEKPKKKTKKAVIKTFIPEEEEDYTVGTRTN